jgi:hypothetical protein
MAKCSTILLPSCARARSNFLYFANAILLSTVRDSMGRNGNEEKVEIARMRFTGVAFVCSGNKIKKNPKMGFLRN